MADASLRVLYGSVPRVPPDETEAVYLQPAVGCPHAACTFCALHKEPFRSRTPEEFGEHLGRVREALGPAARLRSRLYFGDANALSVPAAELADMLRQAREAFPHRPVHACADARLREVDVDALRRLEEAGLRRVTIGLETGHAPLYRSLGKPGTFEDISPGLRRLKEAGIGAGLSVLLGLGGKACRQPHAADTIEFLRSAGLRAPDVVYLLRYRPESSTPYAAAAAADADLRPTDEEYRIQERAFRENLEGELLRRGARLIVGELSPPRLG